MKVEKNFYFWGMMFFSFLFVSYAKAVCPICTVAVGAGVGFSRWLGIDDTITGLWIGGLIVSMGMWTINWLEGKKIKFKGIKMLVMLGYYLVTIMPLYQMGIMGHPFNVLWGVDKLLLGILIGSVVFLFSSFWYIQLKAANKGHAYFPFQKVVMPIVFLTLSSFLFYFLSK